MLWGAGIRAEYLPSTRLSAKSSRTAVGAGGAGGVWSAVGLEGVTEACSKVGVPFVVVVRVHTLVTKRAVKVSRTVFFPLTGGFCFLRHCPSARHAADYDITAHPC
ncbi:unnamed protein product [Discosporangium mesarthrocarpum]